MLTLPIKGFEEKKVDKRQGRGIKSTRRGRVEDYGDQDDDDAYQDDSEQQYAGNEEEEIEEEVEEEIEEEIEEEQ